AKSCPAARTKVTASRSRASPVYQRKFSTERRRFCHIWKIQTAPRSLKNQNARDRAKACRNQRSRSWICCDRLISEMAAKTEKELSEAQRALWLKTLAAMELRNFGYAISLLQGILKQEPQFLTGRQLLRRAEVAKQKAGKKSFFNISTAPIAVMKAQREIKKAPQRAVEMIEKVLEEEPYNRQANLTLKEAAVAAGWPEIGVFALRTLLEENPRDVKLLRELG